MDPVPVKVFGCCVSRDVIDYDLEQGKFGNCNYNVVRFLNLVSPYTMLYGNKLSLTIEELLKSNPKSTAFRARCLAIDAGKYAMTYMAERGSSEWLILDVGNTRCRIVEWKDKGVILTYGTGLIEYFKFICEKLQSDNTCVLYPWELDWDEFVKRFKEIYSTFITEFDPRRVILMKFNAVYDYITLSGQRKSFDNNKILISKKWNELFAYFNNLIEELFPNCHVIEFPDNVIGDASHRWGLAPLHYHKLYYEYAEKAVEIVTKKYERIDEEQKLDFLCQLYSEKFATLREQLKQKDIQRDRDKWRAYSHTFKSLINNNLIENNEKFTSNLANALLAKGSNHIAIYGDTEITKVLVHILLGTSVTIDYIVENAAKPFPGIKTVNRNPADYPNCDLMLVADVFAWQDIKKKLEKLRLPFPFVNAAEFIQSLPAGQGIGELQAYVNSLKEKQADLEENVAQLQKSAEAYAAEKAQMQAAFGELSDRYQASEQKAADLATEVDGLQVKNKAAQRDIEELSVENKAAKEEIEGLHRKQTEAQKQIVAITSQRDAAVADAASLRNSVSYKFGRAMTFLPRKIRDVFKKK